MNATTSSVGWLHSAQSQPEGGSGIVVSSQPIGGRTATDWPRWTAAICIFAAFLAPFISSFLDAAFVIFNRFGQDGYWQIWRIRFISNVLATLTLVPLIVAWGGKGMAGLSRIRRVRFLEAGLLLLCLLLV